VKTGGILALAIFMSLASGSAWAEDRMLQSAIDSHLHFLDFTQRSDGFAALVGKMDAAGVEAAVVFGIGDAEAGAAELLRLDGVAPETLKPLNLRPPLIPMPLSAFGGGQGKVPGFAP
jgi:hypothetical protein